MMPDPWEENLPRCITLPPHTVIRRITLKSYLYGYFGPHHVSELFSDYQLFSISRDGLVTVSAKSEYGPRPAEVESLRFRTDPDRASKLIDEAVEILRNSPKVTVIMDGPMWSLTLTDTNGKRYQSDGCIYADPEYNFTKLSVLIRMFLKIELTDHGRSLIDPSRFALFDGGKDREPDDDRGVFLLDSPVAGIKFACGFGYLAGLEDGEEVRLVREKDNSHDRNAVAVYHGATKIGYIPRSDNTVIANLMDGGRELYAELSDRTDKGIRIQVFLTEF